MLQAAARSAAADLTRGVGSVASPPTEVRLEAEHHRGATLADPFMQERKHPSTVSRIEQIRGCKSRPARSKNKGGSRSFIPWCERRG